MFSQNPVSPRNCGALFENSGAYLLCPLQSLDFLALFQLIAGLHCDVCRTHIGYEVVCVCDLRIAKATVTKTVLVVAEDALVPWPAGCGWDAFQYIDVVRKKRILAW